MKMFDGQVSINKADNSPFWMVSFRSADGKQKRRSTKVPVAGGLFQGKRLSAAQAKKRALIVGVQIAQAAAQEYVAHDNTPVRAFLDGCISRVGKRLRPQSVANFRSARDRFCESLGRRVVMMGLCCILGWRGMIRSRFMRCM